MSMHRLSQHLDSKRDSPSFVRRANTWRQGKASTCEIYNHSQWDSQSFLLQTYQQHSSLHLLWSPLPYLPALVAWWQMLKHMLWEALNTPLKASKLSKQSPTEKDTTSGTFRSSAGAAASAIFACVRVALYGARGLGLPVLRLRELKSPLPVL